MITVRRQHTCLVLSGLFSLLLASCASEPPVEPEPGDGPSTLDIKAEDVADAVPRDEPLARYGNHTPYEVFGKEYYVLQESQDISEKQSLLRDSWLRN